MSPITPEYRELLHGWLKGHAEAVQFICDVFDIIHTVDDLTDGDVDVPVAEVQQRFITALVTLPRNPFYQQFFAQLNSLVEMGIVNGLIATSMERGNHKDIAFILRSSYVDLITACALVLGGRDWAIQVGQEARVHAAREGFTTYCQNLKKETNPQIVRGI